MPMGLKSLNLTSLGFYLLSLWKVFFLHCNALCAWFHSPLWMFPPSYCDKCPHEEKGCGPVIFQWFSSNFSAQSGVGAKTASASSIYLKSVFFQRYIWQTCFSKVYLSKVYFSSKFSIQSEAKRCYRTQRATAHNHSPGCAMRAPGCEPEKSPNFLLIIDRYHPPHIYHPCHSHLG